MIISLAAFSVCGPTLAWGGWYLMEPPSVATPSDRLFLREPLVHWNVLESFDSAADCEKARAIVRRDDRRTESYPACIATNDPRLARFATPVGNFMILAPCRFLPAFRQGDRPARTLGR
jgi:hypothetical protein